MSSAWFLVWCLLFHVTFGVVHRLEQEQPHKERIQAVHPNALSGNAVTANGLELNGITPNSITPNGLELNGLELNGLELNAVSPNGIELNGITPNAMTPNAMTPNAMTPNAIEPNGINPNGIYPNAIHPNAVHPNGVKPNAFYANAISHNDLTVNALAINALTPNALTPNALTPNSLSPNVLSGNALLGNAFIANAVSPNGDASQLPWATEVTFEHLNLVRLVAKYGVQLNITDPDMENTTRWSVVNVTLKDLRGSELVGSLFATVEGETYEIPLSGTDMNGLVFKYLVVDAAGDWGLTIMRIDQVSTDVTGEIYFYKISSFNWANGVWNSVCQKNGNDTEAILLNNYWDPVNESKIYSPPAVTIACRRYAIAKCVEWGYLPWKNATYCSPAGACESVSLQDYHQACTRMCRADYCGNGTGWTQDGTLIDIWDNLTPPIQARAAPQWHVEAEWTTEGAVCLSGTRLAKWDEAGQPQCSNKPDLRDQLNCGSGVGSRALLGTSFPPAKETEESQPSSSLSSAELTKIVVPSVVVPLALVIGVAITIFLLRRQRESLKQEEKGAVLKQVDVVPTLGDDAPRSSTSSAEGGETASGSVV